MREMLARLVSNIFFIFLWGCGVVGGAGGKDTVKVT